MNDSEGRPGAAAGGSGSHLDAEGLVALVDELVRELRAGGAAPSPVTLDTDLGRDLGLDSLSRMELIARIERATGVSLPDRVMADAETPRDLLRAAQRAGGRSSGAARAGGVASRWAVSPGDPPGGREAAPSGADIARSAETLVDALASHATHHPERVHVRLLDEAEVETPLTYGELLERARRVAGGLVERGVAPGRSVALMLPTGIDYLACFLGVQLAGAVPLPIYPPARIAQLEDHFRRHERILANAAAQYLVTFDEARTVSRLLAARAGERCGLATAAELGQSEALDLERAAAPGPDDTAFLQYTSGSTGQPKGVILTHRNVIASLHAMAQALRATPRDVFVSWLPLYHDMGLIGGWLGSLVYGFPLVLMSPLTFLARPARLLRAIGAYGGTLSGGPNFAFELCTRRVADEEIEGVDLSTWRLAFNGAEPVNPDTLAAFAHRFAPFGFDARAFAPVYGLAEATLGVAFTPLERGPKVESIERAVMERDRRALPVAAGTEAGAAALTFVSSGVPIPGFEVRIVDDAGREAPERMVGRLQFKGPSTTSGYFRNATATKALFDGEWLESGDLAYVAGGEVFITGRGKEVIIRGGRNLYPYELELAAGGVSGVRRGCVAVFGAGDPEAGTERLVMVAETRERGTETRAPIRAALERLAVDVLGQPVDEVVLVPPHTVLKTSSGKIRRQAMAELYRSGHLGTVDGRRPPWLRMVRLGASGIGPFVRRFLAGVRERAYAGWVWAMIGAMAAVAWPLIAIARRPAFGQWFMRGAGRAVLALSGIPLRVSGASRIPRDAACVITSNHASYFDGLVLFAALPAPVCFVAKAELRENPWVRWFLDGLGVLPVERFDTARGAAHAGALTESLRAGRSIAIFPEGTLHRMPGLLPFQMGAFAAAVDAGTPVVPVILRGTRSVMRSETWFPRWAKVEVRIGEPVRAAVESEGAEPSSGWSRSIALRDAVRAWMLANCGEPDLVHRNALRELAERRAAEGRATTDGASESPG